MTILILYATGMLTAALVAYAIFLLFGFVLMGTLALLNEIAEGVLEIRRWLSSLRSKPKKVIELTDAVDDAASLHGQNTDNEG